jgi:DivIVA domain-containing protein
VVLIVVVLAGVIVLLGFALMLSLNDDGLPDEVVDHGDLGMPDRQLSADDVAGLRFRTGFRGYRMEDVDAALARLAQSMRANGPSD